MATHNGEEGLRNLVSQECEKGNRQIIIPYDIDSWRLHTVRIIPLLYFRRALSISIIRLPNVQWKTSSLPPTQGLLQTESSFPTFTPPTATIADWVGTRSQCRSAIGLALCGVPHSWSAGTKLPFSATAIISCTSTFYSTEPLGFLASYI